VGNEREPLVRQAKLGASVRVIGRGMYEEKRQELGR